MKTPIRGTLLPMVFALCFVANTNAEPTDLAGAWSGKCGSPCSVTEWKLEIGITDGKLTGRLWAIGSPESYGDGWKSIDRVSYDDDKLEFVTYGNAGYKFDLVFRVAKDKRALNGTWFWGSNSGWIDFSRTD